MFSPKVIRSLVFWVMLLTGWECSGLRGTAERSDEYARTVAVHWNRMLLELERFTPGYKPPVSARMFAYVNLAAYETISEGFSELPSMEAYFKGYQRSAWSYSGSKVCTGAALNASYSAMVRYFFPKASIALLEKASFLERQLAEEARLVCDSATIFQSERLGREIADGVWKWSTTDTIGHDAYLSCFNPNYQIPVCAGCWQPAKGRFVQPMLPFWGGVRPFLIGIKDLEPKPPAGYSEVPGSPFYNQAMEVFTLSHAMSKSNQWISEFWSDDVSGLTITPAGRWISIANQVIEKEKPSSIKTIVVYLKTSLALSDALVACWGLKYRYNIERPQTYINRVIQSDWQPYIEDPPFPSYPAGHAMLSAAAAVVLEDAFGSSYQLTDYTHDGRQEYAGMPRTFHSFTEMAHENALSRLWAGVHFRMDCDEGARLGSIIGHKIAELPIENR